MYPRELKETIEHLFGNQPINYLTRLINDGLIDIGIKKKHNVQSRKHTLTKDQRYYEFNKDLIDVVRVDIKNNDGRYEKIPKLVDSHNLKLDDAEGDY